MVVGTDDQVPTLGAGDLEGHTPAPGWAALPSAVGISSSVSLRPPSLPPSLPSLTSKFL